MAIFETDYNTKIDNSDSEALITSVMFYVRCSDVLNSSITKTIEIRLKNSIDYEIIFEQVINNKYIKSDKGIIITEDEDLRLCKELSIEQIKCILGFISYNKRALDIFKEYLIKTNNSYLIPDDNVIEEKQETDISYHFNFEQYTDKKEDENSNSMISGFFSTQFKNGNNLEKVIKIKKEGLWQTIYYCIYYKDNEYIVIDSEMVKNLDSVDINLVLEYIKYDNRCIDDFNLYLQRTNFDFDKTK